ncbi:MAG: polynucleotide adenylyltransferase [Eggerthellaceae bacterium]|nr:polynucleotide adenylyltransferase [Eggerthellaceae bacterium]
MEEAGYDSWLVGGCVRDALLGRDVYDFDLASSANWKEAKSVFEAAEWMVRETGTQHGTITIISPEKKAFELTTFRTDGNYGDFRHPDNIEYVKSIEEDLSRRDFRINAMAWKPGKGLFDPFDGEADLKSKIIRTVGNPSQRFNEDALRILRVLRFAAQLGFEVESETLLAAEQNKGRLVKISQERKRDEFCKIMLGDFVVQAIRQYKALLAPIIPEIVAIFDFGHISAYHMHDLWEHTLHALGHISKDLLMRVVLLVHDSSKAAASFIEGDIQHFYGHAELSVLLCREALRRLKFSSRFIEDACKLVGLHEMSLLPSKKSVRRAVRAFDGSSELFRKFVEVRICDLLAYGETLNDQVQPLRDALVLFEKMQAEAEVFSISDLVINGHDILESGVQEGEEVGKLLNKALLAVTEHELPNEKDALLAYLLQ